MINLMALVLALGFYIGQLVAFHEGTYSQNTVLAAAIFGILGGTGIIIRLALKKKEEQESKSN